MAKQSQSNPNCEDYNITVIINHPCVDVSTFKCMSESMVMFDGETYSSMCP